MRNLTENINSKYKLSTASDNHISGVDTSLLYEELRGQFKKTGLPIEVSFRQLASWVTLGDQFTHQLHPYPAKPVSYTHL